MSDPVILHGRRLGCRNSKLEVFLDHIEDPAGTVPDFMVVSPRARAVAGGVTGVAVLPVYRDAVGLLRIFRHPLRDYTWEIPRGFIEPDEEPIAAARRELEEETGLSCDTESIESLGVVEPEPGILNARTQLYLARDCRRARSNVEGEIGHQELVFVAPAELERMVRDEELREACTVIAALHYVLARQRD